MRVSPESVGHISMLGKKAYAVIDGPEGLALVLGVVVGLVGASFATPDSVGTLVLSVGASEIPAVPNMVTTDRDEATRLYKQCLDRYIDLADSINSSKD